MQQVIKIIGETPAKKNSRINLKNGRSIPSKRYQEWHKQAVDQILMHHVKPYFTPVKIELYFVHGDLRRRDSDNGTSSILDTLVDCGVISDDNWKQVPEINVKNFYKKNEPCCYIKITEVKTD